MRWSTSWAGQGGSPHRNASLLDLPVPARRRHHRCLTDITDTSDSSNMVFEHRFRRHSLLRPVASGRCKTLYAPNGPKYMKLLVSKAALDGDTTSSVVSPRSETRSAISPFQWTVLAKTPAVVTPCFSTIVSLSEAAADLKSRLLQTR